MLFAAWKISAEFTWKKTLNKRAEYLYQRDKERFDFEHNYGKTLKSQHVLANASLRDKQYELIFYFFIPPDVEFLETETFLGILKLLDYLFDKKGLAPEKHIVFVCGQKGIFSKLDLLKNDMDFKFVMPVLVNQNVYRELSLPLDRSALVITDHNSTIVWCSVPPPKNTAYSKILDKFVAEPES